MSRRALLFSLVFLSSVPARVSSQPPPDLSRLTLEELLNVDITSVSRKPQSLASAPAAVFVITQDEIRESGASSLPEVLRLAPGLQVARYSGSKWSVGSRGMGSYYGSKLLVLVDGRSVFTPDFSGVHWDLQEVPLESIERIEVVRGPGGTMWGANAFNGVINIITKSSADTRGGLVTLGTGSEDRGLASFRYGGQADARTTYRLDGSLSDRASAGSDPSEDTRRIARGGFRVDRVGGADAITIHGDVYTADERLPLTVPDVASRSYARIVDDRVTASAGNVTARWTRTLSPSSDLSVGAYVDHSRRDEYIHEYSSDVVNVDVQHRLRLGRRHDVIWGAEYRQTRTDITVSDVMRYAPGLTNRYLFDAFVQDEIAMAPRLSLTVGSKIEQHEAVGRAIEPNARLMWTPHARHNVWAAVSRGVRTPSLSDQNAVFDYSVIPPSAATAGLPVLIRVVGEPEMDLESVVAFEAGYRLQPAPTLAFDVAAFRNEYDHLSSYARGPARFSVEGGVPHLVVESRHQNLAEGETHGVEALATWTPVVRWTLTASSTLMDANLRMSDPAIESGATLLVLLESPRVQFNVRSTVRATRTVDVTAAVYRVGAWQMGGVAGYSRVDLHGGWNVSPGVALTAGVQNLFDRRHGETALYLYETPAEIARSAYVRASLRF